MVSTGARHSTGANATNAAGAHCRASAAPTSLGPAPDAAPGFQAERPTGTGLQDAPPRAAEAHRPVGGGGGERSRRTGTPEPDSTHQPPVVPLGPVGSSAALGRSPKRAAPRRKHGVPDRSPAA